MDEKLRKSLTAIICDTVECTEPLDCDMASTCPYVNDGLPQIEQAFQDDGWIEPQQPVEGELVPCFDDVAKHGMKFVWEMAVKAQLAFDLATMVKLPTELWLAEHLHSARFEWKDNWRDYKNREQVGGNLYGFMAKRLLNRLKEQKP
jgi:hypothetical protein